MPQPFTWKRAIMIGIGVLALLGSATPTMSLGPDAVALTVADRIGPDPVASNLADHLSPGAFAVALANHLGHNPVADHLAEPLHLYIAHRISGDSHPDQCPDGKPGSPNYQSEPHLHDQPRMQRSG